VARGDAVYVYAYPDGLGVGDVLGLDSSRLIRHTMGEFRVLNMLERHPRGEWGLLGLL